MMVQRERTKILTIDDYSRSMDSFFASTIITALRIGHVISIIKTNFHVEASIV